MTLTIAVDLGGTHIRTAAFQPDSITPVNHHRTRTLAAEGGVFDRVVKAVEAVWVSGDVNAISIASPGPLDPYTGTILATPNITEWINYPLADNLSKHFGVPAFLNNDANMAALGEWKFGAGVGHHDLVYVTISTGVGGGVISHDQLVQGFHGLGAELGHMIIDPEGPPCGCGKNGHVESFCSGPSIARYVNERIRDGEKSSLQAHPELSAAQVADAARQGDALAIAAFNRAAHYLGIGVANYLAIFDPSILIFGGGVSQVGELLFKPFEESLRNHTFHPHYLDNLIIERAQLADNAGLLGALALSRIKLADSNTMRVE